MRAIVRLAYRFLSGRAGWRSVRFLAAVGAVALSVVPLVTVEQVAEGMIQGIVERFIETGSAHLQARARGEITPGEIGAMVEQLSTLDGVVSAVPERQGFGLLHANGARTGVSVRAVPNGWWAEDETVQRLIEVSEGTFDLTSPRAIVLGRESATALGVHVGDEVRLLTVRNVGESSSMARVTRFTVSGVVGTGYRELDRLWVFIPWETGQRVLAGDGASDLIAIKVDEPYLLPNPIFSRGIERVAHARKAEQAFQTLTAVRNEAGSQWLVYDWYTVDAGRFLSFLTSRNLLVIVMAMIVVVAMVNISSALVLVVIEKERDIAILRATGVSQRTIGRVFLSCGAIIGGAGALLGSVVGLTLAVRINGVLQAIESFVSWVAGRSIDVFQSEFYLETIPISITVWPVLGAIVLTVVLAIIAALIPAYRAARILPDRILRHQGGWSSGAPRGKVRHL